MANIKLDLGKGVVRRRNSLYRRFKVRCPETGKWKDKYVPLGKSPDAPDYVTKLLLAERNRPTTFAMAEAMPPAEVRNIASLIELFIPIMEAGNNKQGTLANKRRHLAMIKDEHGSKMVADITGGWCYQVRDSMRAMPGKANCYMSALKQLLQFGVQYEWLAANPARGIAKFELDESDPWPPELVEAMLERSSPMLRLAIITALCSGQRISDIIRMEYEWIRDGMMFVPESVKTCTSAYIPINPLWAAEIAKHPRKRANVVALPVNGDKPAGETILKSERNKAYGSSDQLQKEVAKLMKELGHGPEMGRNAYSFHGLSKNAICTLTEMGETVETISAIVGKTPDTVRYYAKEANKWMLAKAAADRIKAADFGAMTKAKAVGA